MAEIPNLIFSGTVIVDARTLSVRVHMKDGGGLRVYRECKDDLGGPCWRECHPVDLFEGGGPIWRASIEAAMWALHVKNGEEAVRG